MKTAAQAAAANAAESAAEGNDAEGTTAAAAAAAAAVAVAKGDDLVRVVGACMAVGTDVAPAADMGAAHADHTGYGACIDLRAAATAPGQKQMECRSSGHEQANVSSGQQPGVGGRRAGQLSWDAFQISAAGILAADVLKLHLTLFSDIFRH